MKRDTRNCGYPVYPMQQPMGGQPMMGQPMPMPMPMPAPYNSCDMDLKNKVDNLEKRVS